MTGTESSYWIPGVKGHFIVLMFKFDWIYFVVYIIINAYCHVSR